MVTLFIILVIAGILLYMVTGVAALFLDPLIAICIIALIVKLIKKIFGKK